MNIKAIVLIAMSVLTTMTACRPSTETIDVAAKWTAGEQASFEAVLESFAGGRSPKTIIRYHSIKDDIGEELRKRVQKGGTFDQGGPPDIAVLPQTGTMDELAGRKALVALDDIVGEQVDQNYSKVWRDLGTVDKSLYGVWYKANNKSVFWYRAQMFQEAQVTPPRTWDELQGVAKGLMDARITPLAVGGGDAWNLTDWFENVYLRTAGGESYTQLACRRILFTDRSVKEALTTMSQVLGRREWVAGGADAVFTTYEKSVEQVFGDPPRAAMLSGADYVAGEIAKYGNVRDARFFDFPSVRGSRPSLLIGGDVAVMLKSSDASRSLIKFLATPEAAEPWAKQGGFLSPNKSVLPSVYPNELFPLVQAVREAGVVNDARYDLSDQFPPSFGSTNGQGMFKIFQDYLRDPTSVDSTATRLEEQASVVPREPCL